MATRKNIMLHVIILGVISTLTGVKPLGEMVIGDIQLVPHDTTQGYYQPLVYFTNGIEPPQLGGICYDNIGRTQATVICNQLGYELKDFMGASGPTTSYPIWLSDVKCDENQQLQHILSCDYDVTFGFQREQGPCKTGRYVIVSCDWEKPLTMGKYDGYILLCPPDNFTATTTSTSFGLVIIYLSKYDIWRGLNQPNGSEPLGLNEANAICQQLGYTTAVPGSAVTTRAVQPDYTFDHCYDQYPPFRVQREAWMPTNDIHCPGPQTCFGCCYNYPSTDNCASCDRFNDLVVQCSFAPDQAHLSSGKGGEENECIYSNTPCNSTSKNGEGQHGKTFSNTCAGVIVSTNVVVLIITALISIATVYIIKKKCRRNNAAEEVRVQEGRGQEANNEGRPLIEGDDHAPGGEHGAIN